MTNDLRLAALLLAAATTACAMGRRPPASGEKTMITQEWKGQQGGPELHGHQIVYDDIGWQGGWLELKQAAPPLDMTKYAAVFVYVGRKTTGGYKVVWDEPVPQGDDLKVSYRILKPEGMVTQALTAPWAVHAFPKPKRFVVVEYKVR